MAIDEEIPASPSMLGPAVSEINHRETGILKMRLLLLVLVLFESSSVLVARLCSQLRSEFVYSVQIGVGFSVLALILTLHFSSEHKILPEMTAALITANCYVGKLEEMSLIDPETQLFNRRYLAQLFDHQLKIMNRTCKLVTLLLLEVSAFEQSSALDTAITEFAFILRSNFRASDYLVRFSKNQFLAVLPDTDGQQAQIALSRLIDKVRRWNSANASRQIVLSLELSTSVPDARLWLRLSKLEEKLGDKSAPELRILVPAEA